MGNHEYCEDCGENDFHSHRDCDPEKVAKRKAQKEAYEKEKAEGISILKEALDKAGFNYEIDEYGNAKIQWYSFKKELNETQ